MNPSPMARKLNRPGGKTLARKERIVRTIAAKKQNVETMSRYRSTRSPNSKIVAPAWQSGVFLQHRMEIAKTVRHYEHQTSHSRNRRRLHRPLGNGFSYSRDLDDARLSRQPITLAARRRHEIVHGLDARRSTLVCDYLRPPLDPLGRDRASWLRHWIRFAHGPLFGSLGHHHVCRHSHALLDRL